MVIEWDKNTSKVTKNMEHMNIDDEIKEYLEHDWGKDGPKSQPFSDKKKFSDKKRTDENVKKMIADARQMELGKKQKKVTKY